jgi:hypothetical protein
VQDLEDDLTTLFFMDSFKKWLALDESIRTPVPIGLMSRDEEFKQRFVAQANSCDQKKGVNIWNHLAERGQVPVYGKFCGAGKSVATKCQGANARMGRSTDDMRCGHEVCADHGLDEACCEHDHSRFTSKIMYGHGGVFTQPCQVDQKFSNHLETFKEPLEFDDGGGQLSSLERNGLMGAKCYLYAVPCLVFNPQALMWRQFYAFGNYPKNMPSHCAGKDCWREELEMPQQFVTPIVDPIGWSYGITKYA